MASARRPGDQFDVCAAAVDLQPLANNGGRLRHMRAADPHRDRKGGQRCGRRSARRVASVRPAAITTQPACDAPTSRVEVPASRRAECRARAVYDAATSRSRGLHTSRCSPTTPTLMRIPHRTLSRKPPGTVVTNASRCVTPVANFVGAEHLTYTTTTGISYGHSRPSRSTWLTRQSVWPFDHRVAVCRQIIIWRTWVSRSARPTHGRPCRRFGGGVQQLIGLARLRNFSPDAGNRARRALRPSAGSVTPRLLSSSLPPTRRARIHAWRRLWCAESDPARVERPPPGAPRRSPVALSGTHPPGFVPVGAAQGRAQRSYRGACLRTHPPGSLAARFRAVLRSRAALRIQMPHVSGPASRSSTAAAT